VRQGWVQCEDHLPYYKDNANGILLDSTAPRPARTSAEAPGVALGPARVGLFLGLQCNARALFRTVSFKIK
jgi:hypothetical protein